MGQITLHPDVYQKISTVYFEIICKTIKGQGTEASIKHCELADAWDFKYCTVLHYISISALALKSADNIKKTGPSKSISCYSVYNENQTAKNTVHNTLKVSTHDQGM